MTFGNPPRMKAPASRIVSLAKVLASADVPEAVYEKRMAECRVCAHSREGGGRHWCRCCGCPRWIAGRLGSSLEFKNRKAAWACPMTIPAFGPHDE